MMLRELLEATRSALSNIESSKCERRWRMQSPWLWLGLPPWILENSFSLRSKGPRWLSVAWTPLGPYRQAGLNVR